MNTGHSILPPSGADAWSQCPMWVTMNQRYPRPDSVESAEGVAAHWVAQEVLLGNEVLEGTRAPNGVVVTDETIHGALVLKDAVSMKIPTGTFGKLHIEEPVSINLIHSKCWGTPDVWAFSLAPLKLEVIDYKFGHAFVEEYENKQGVAYIAGVIEKISKVLGIEVCSVFEKLDVNFTIVQPRCFYKGKPVRTWNTKGSD